MKKFSLRSLLVASVLGCTATVSAQLITPAAITGSGNHVNRFGVIADGIVPAQGTVWTSLTNVWWLGLGTSITLDFGGKYLVNDLLLSVDNNDSYAVDYSMDGVSFNNLFLIRPSDGDVPAWPGGMDTMSTNSTSPHYVSRIDFTPFSAQYVKFHATGGDGLFAIGELEAFGVPVPEPSTYGLMGAAALTSLIAYRHRRAD